MTEPPTLVDSAIARIHEDRMLNEAEQRAVTACGPAGPGQRIMTYYPTLDEDLARAKEILAKGKPPVKAGINYELIPALMGDISGGDIYAAYKLLESFVAEIERLRLPGPLSGLQHAKYLNPACGEHGCQWLTATYENQALRAQLAASHAAANDPEPER